MNNPYSYEVVIHDKDIEPLAKYYFDTDDAAETFKRGIVRSGRLAKINKINLNDLNNGDN
jgi:hypothetical protein